MPWFFVPAKYHKTCFNAAKCCKLGLAVYDASLFMVKAISGRVQLVRYWSSPRSLAKELLRFPSFPSGLGSSLMLGSNGSHCCYVEFHPEHSPMFSGVLCSHVTSFHAFHPNLPLWNINTLWSSSATFPRQHHIHHTNHGWIMPGLSWNHLGTFQAVMEWHQKYHRFI